MSGGGGRDGKEYEFLTNGSVGHLSVPRQIASVSLRQFDEDSCPLLTFANAFSLPKERYRSVDAMLYSSFSSFI